MLAAVSMEMLIASEFCTTEGSRQHLFHVAHTMPIALKGVE